jgi:hypothetical protein
MKTSNVLKLLALLLIVIFSFSKVKKTTPKATLNFEKINIVQILSEQEFECRPSAELTFYVESTLVKKFRGYSTINATVFALNRFSGESSLLANENIIVPFHKDAVLHYDKTKSDCEKTILTNGDRIVGSQINTKYCFNELIKHEVIYNSYIRSTNKLLDIQRIF